MKKLLSLFSVIGLTASASTVISFASIQHFNQKNDKPAIPGQILLSSVILNPDLGEFDHVLNNQEILNQIKLLNPEVNLNEVEIETTWQENLYEIILKVIDKSSIYQSKEPVKLFYKLLESQNSLKHLEDVLTITDLGYFESYVDFNNDGILSRIKELNPAVDISQIEVKKNPDFNEFKIRPTINATSYWLTEDWITLTYLYLPEQGKEKRIFIQDDLINYSLGTFDIQPTKQEILNHLKIKNPKLNITQIIVDQNVEESKNWIYIHVIPNSSVYWPAEKIKITYELSSKAHLTNVVKITDLGEFNYWPSEIDILNRVKELNPDLNANQVYVQSLYPQLNFAELLPIYLSDVYWVNERIKLTFKMNGPLLKDIVKITDLGEFDFNPSTSDILERVKKLNPDLDISQVSVYYQKGRSEAQLAVIDDSKIYWPETLTLRFNLALVDLTDVVKITDLGEFETYPTEEEILQRVKELNPNLDLSQVYVEKVDNKISYLNVKPNAGRYADSSLILFYKLVVPDLEDIVEITDLGEFETYPTDEDILQRVKVLNPILDLSEVYIERDDNEIIFLKVKRNAVRYVKKSVLILTYKLVVPDLKDIVEITDLGEFETYPTEEEILQRVKELNPNLDLSEIFLRTIESGTIELKVKWYSMKYIRDSIVTLTYKNLLPKLEDVVKVTDLGEFETYPTNKEILNRVKALNPDLDLGEVFLANSIDDQKIDLKVDLRTTKYIRNGVVTLTYKLENIPLLEDVVKITDLGGFNFYPTEEELLERVKELNPDLDLNEVFSTGWIGKHKIQLKVHSWAVIKYVKNSVVTLTYKLENIPLLEDVVKVTDLGEFINMYPTDDEFLNRVKELNPDLDLGEVFLEGSMEDQEIKLKVRSWATKYVRNDVVTLTYKIKDVPLLEDVVKQTDLDEFNYWPSEIDILNRVKELNPDLDLGEAFLEGSIEDQEIKLKVGSWATKYVRNDVLTLTYKILLPKLEDVVKNLDLGEFDFRLTDEEFLKQIKKLNPDLDLNQINFKSYFEIGDVKKGYAFLSVKDNSNLYFKDDIKLEVSYRAKFFDLSSVVDTIDLGDFDNKPTDEEVLSRLKELNVHLNLDTINFSHHYLSETEGYIRVWIKSAFVPWTEKVLTNFYHIKN